MATPDWSKSFEYDLCTPNKQPIRTQYPSGLVEGFITVRTGNILSHLYTMRYIAKP